MRPSVYFNFIDGSLAVNHKFGNTKLHSVLKITFLQVHASENVVKYRACRNTIGLSVKN